MITKWYKHEKTISHITYDIIRINKTNIIVTTDPLDGWNENDAKKIDAWINVSDTPCNSLSYLPWKCERFWFPVAEVHNWTYNHAFWIKTILDKLVFERDDIKNIVIHCHAGARRSPFSLFMWLTSRYGVNAAAKIMWPGKTKIQKSKIQNLKIGGHYGELCSELENFYKICELESGKSFESILLTFSQIAKKELPLPKQLSKIRKRKKLTKKQIMVNLNKWYPKQLTQKKENLLLDTKNISYYGFLIRAEEFYKKQKCKFDANYFYNWYINSLLKKDYWYCPVLVSKNKIVNKGDLKLMELSEYIQQNKYVKINIKKEKGLVEVNEL